ncbi:hypothetical protein F5Y01DRAFT_288979 [Xylaria sp. FL0043]|nr:hypothetical protein F5Y01DRAFT_288979 [Xylaria sp. FL0043]
MNLGSMILSAFFAGGLPLRLIPQARSVPMKYNDFSTLHPMLLRALLSYIYRIRSIRDKARPAILCRDVVSGFYDAYGPVSAWYLHSVSTQKRSRWLHLLKFRLFHIFNPTSSLQVGTVNLAALLRLYDEPRTFCVLSNLANVDSTVPEKVVCQAVSLSSLTATQKEDYTPLSRHDYSSSGWCRPGLKMIRSQAQTPFLRTEHHRYH